jgi:hypothetical protein
MIKNNVELKVVINAANTHLTREYVSPLDLQTYIEGREGSVFTLRIENKNDFRVLAIPSVDGLSVLDGKPAGEHSSGYILEARQILDIPGWKVDSDTVAKFFFAGMKNDVDQSYVAQSGNDTLNKGVIGLMIFREKHTYSFPKGGMVWASASANPNPTGNLRSVNSCFGAAFNTLGSSTATLQSSGISDSVLQDTQLGTGFGAATEFVTKKAEFERGDLHVIMVLYYKDAKGLRKVGIDITKPVETKPNAFPASLGCKPPAGWANNK